MSLMTRAGWPVGPGWLMGRRPARTGWADAPSGGTESGMELLGGVHGQHSAPATLDRNWDQTWDQREIDMEISDGR